MGLPVKLLVNPLLWVLLLQLVAVALLRPREKRERRVVVGLLLGTVLLALWSTPLVGKELLATLEVPASSGSVTPPAVIFVLGGGYLGGATPEEDLPVVETQRRVLHGIALWHRFPQARLVFSGAEPEQNGRRADRGVELMALEARRRGVPAEAVLVEARSRNTREHPVCALGLPGVTSGTPVAVVTSGWHMRRAQREFQRYFRDVRVAPVALMRQGLSARDLVPDAVALETNTTLVREWVGIWWYAFRGI